MLYRWLSRFPFSLKYSIPLLILILGSLLSGTTIYHQVSAVKRQFQLDAISTGELDGQQASALLNYIYRSENLQTNEALQTRDGANLLISKLESRPNLDLALLFNENLVAIAATDGRVIDSMLEALPIRQHADLIKAVSNRRRGETILSADRQRVIAAYPVVIKTGDDGAMPEHVGVIVLEYDLAGPRQALVNAAIWRSLSQMAILMFTCLMIGLFLEFYVTRRAARLVEVSEALAANELTARAQLNGSDELAKVAEAFDQMAAQLQDDTEALQLSEAELWLKTEDYTKALDELQQAQLQLVQSEKMSSLGQLVAGVAHEINNPVNFIYGNLSHARGYAEDLLRLIDHYQTHYPTPASAILEEIEAIDLEFVRSDFPQMMQSMKSGAERIQGIVKSLRIFSRMDESAIKEVNLHEGIDSTLVILQNRLKAKDRRPEIIVHKQYGTLPLVECYAGQLNQVFMNIISNAIDALEEAWAKDEALRPSIKIVTVSEGDRITIEIIDNGPGIPADVQDRLFNPFFTTKPVGKGTGMGLSISYQIVTEKHGGRLSCTSAVGQGTTFRIQIPNQPLPPALTPQTDPYSHPPSDSPMSLTEGVFIH